VTSFFRKIFGRKEELDEKEPETVPVETSEEILDTSLSPTIPNETAPLPQDQIAEAAFHINPQQLIVGTGHSVGRQRDHNEDAILTLSTSFVADSKQMSFGLFVVADGMGGHQHGEIASALAIRAIAGNIVRKLYLPLYGLNQEQPSESLQEIMQEAVMDGHKAIIKDSVNSGTTVTAAIILGDQLMISHVGDSRAYAIYQDGSLKVLTRDHSLVKRLEELGQITSEEAALHPQRNVLYRALGQNEPFEPDSSTHPLPRGGHLMICSDGMWGTMSSEDITEIVLNTPNPEVACQKLVDKSNENGGPDNISVILVYIPS
jgi:serine/threonine protein phosphatase PrpC